MVELNNKLKELEKLKESKNINFFDFLKLCKDINHISKNIDLSNLNIDLLEFDNNYSKLKKIIIMNISKNFNISIDVDKFLLILDEYFSVKNKYFSMILILLEDSELNLYLNEILLLFKLLNLKNNFKSKEDLNNYLMELFLKNNYMKYFNNEFSYNLYYFDLIYRYNCNIENSYKKYYDFMYKKENNI